METLFDNPGTLQYLQKIEEAFLKISLYAPVKKEFPQLHDSVQNYLSVSQKRYDDETETAFLNLYCEIHRTGSVYSSSERLKLDGKHGYFNHPGGISPLLRAQPYLKEESISADLGAGNGLQGLLFQYLYPHRKTWLIELSAEMIRIGKIYQEALGIPDEKIEWINDDIMNVSLDPVDFLYLYRPSKPINDGIALYHYLERQLNSRKNPVTIFSIADCLKDYLDDSYTEFYNDGHLTCFNRTA